MANNQIGGSNFDNFEKVNQIQHNLGRISIDSPSGNVISGRQVMNNNTYHGSHIHQSPFSVNVQNTTAGVVTYYGTSSGAIQPRSAEDVVKQLQEHFRTLYKTDDWRRESLPLAKPELLEKVSIELTREENPSLFPNATKETIKYEDILEPVTGREPPNRLLILGDDETGKSSLVAKLIRDWAERKNNVSLEKYEMALLFELQKLQQKVDLEDVIIEMLRGIAGHNGSKDDFEEILQKHSEKFLIILDGFNQIEERQKCSVKQFMSSYNFELATVLVTALRPECDQKIGSSFQRIISLPIFSD